MKKSSLSLITGFVAGVIAVTSAPFAANAQLAVQHLSDVVGSGKSAWSYLILEGENYTGKLAADDVGFTKVYADEAITNSLGNPVLATNTTASQKGALYAASPNFGQFIDKVTYQVQFATPGTYYMYMRFTMFDNAGGNGQYLSEDSFFFPPDFNKDPQNDWPIPQPTPNGQSGGYCEGCCGTSGWLYFPSVGDPTRIANTTDTNYWEGHTFAWNDLFSSQFMPATVGEANLRFKYEVTPAMLGVPQNFTIGYREAGLTIDLFLFSTHSNLLNFYTQANLDDLLLKKTTVQDPGDEVGTGTNAWSYLILEGENYYSKVNTNSGVGFTKVYNDGAITNSLGNPVLGTDTTASQKGALYAASPNFGQFIDKVTYSVQFATPGTYYTYMRFTMFDNAGGNGQYLSEDSFFFPPDFNKDPQNDWPIPQPTPNGQSGGYCEGCCGTSGWLHFPSVGDPTRVANTTDTNYWEGHTFAWNDLFSSQFMLATVGEASLRFKYEVTPAMLGVPQNFTIGYREAGLAIDLFLFSTHSNLLNFYTQTNLDDILVNKYKLTVQDPGDTVGTGTNAWSYLILEGEDYGPKANTNSGVGFTKVYADEAITNSLGNPVLATNTTASQKGALYAASPNFGQFIDKVTYQVQFATPGTYYMYMRFTMFDNAGGNGQYLSEDSFFFPPDFNKDPQNDWPIPQPTPNGQSGGYCEGCCGTSGWLYFPSVGDPTRVANTTDTNYWEGHTFAWNDLFSSQFMPATVGEANLRFKYEVTPAMLGVPQNFTIGYREAGLTIDLFLFSTHSNLLNFYTQADLDQLFINPLPKLGISLGALNTAVLSWPVSATGFVLESTISLSSPSWNPVTTPPVVIGDQSTVTVNAASGTTYYRLRKP